MASSRRREQMNRQRASELQKFLFTSTKPDENEHRCVVVIDEKHAASFRHGGHSQLKMDDPVMLYNVVEPMLQYESKVTAVSENHDIIVFKLTKGTFKNFPRNTGTLFGGKEYLQLGVHSGREPMWNQGIISERKIGFYIGTSHRMAGDLGSGIFDSAGYFLGISTTKRENMPIASHHQDTRIVSSDVIFAFAGIVDEEEAEEYKPIEEIGEDHEDDKVSYFLCRVQSNYPGEITWKTLSKAVIVFQISREAFASRPALNRQMRKKTALELEKLLFTSTKPDENVHRCVVVIDKKNAVSYRHGGHSQLKIYDKVMLYNVLEPSMIYEVFSIMQTSC
ncbi:hypothetical protein B9Z55_009778 [Caenorhabditis nigoni]|nr:hypothetical protein B9Z55_009778 [Caenorhabditis nigoni]